MPDAVIPWLIQVAAQAKLRPWWSFQDGDATCAGCGSVSEERYRRTLPSENHSSVYLCRFALIDDALDKEPR